MPKSHNEVEKVFRLRRLPKNLDRYPSQNIMQGYLAVERDGSEVRLRKIGKRYVQTFKGSGRLQRRELETELSRRQFDVLWPATKGRRIEKVRYKVDAAGQKIELNIYRGKLAGLALAEVEFPSRAKSESFQPPDWLGKDVTDDKRYKNQNLAQRGAPKGALNRPR
jgi:adenylate cyclase